ISTGDKSSLLMDCGPLSGEALSSFRFEANSETPATAQKRIARCNAPMGRNACKLRYLPNYCADGRIGNV
ncbi:hypothetical protein, partial [Mesorhizobium sp. M4A.F.Ca.ET.050.02.1.1]|uniref:hypothetical protein n=1 Tax=Mesorhizobium sp. M4A.F.Ca.ET.050.02.1.1 TaxID=2496754 RepID=UPI001AECA1AD